MSGKQKKYDPLDGGKESDYYDQEEDDEYYDEYDEEGDGYYDEEISSSLPNTARQPKKKEYMGKFADTAYFRYTDSEDESDNMEANYDEIQDEEFESRMIGQQEDEEELEKLRQEKQRRKWRALKKQGINKNIDDVSVSDISDNLC